MSLERWILSAPRSVARAAATATPDREEQWMLRQAREVRLTYVREVLDRGGSEVHKQMWMLRQPDHVRISFVEEVLEPAAASLSNEPTTMRSRWRPGQRRRSAAGANGSNASTRRPRRNSAGG